MEDDEDNAEVEEDDSGFGNEAEERDKEESPIPEGQYEVEEIIDYVHDKQGDLYLIKWKGWETEHNTWEPPSSLLNCHEAKSIFYMKRKGEIEEILTQSEYVVIENGRKRRKGPPLKVQLPPDPRPLEERADEFYKSTRYPTSDEIELETLWKKDFWNKNPKMKDSKSKPELITRWNRLRLDNALNEAAKGVHRTPEADTLLRKQLFIQQLDESRENATHSLRKWEEELNSISEGKPLIKVENTVDWAGPPMDFTYINDYRPSKDVIIPDDPIVGCSCNSCYDDRKDCCAAQFNAFFAYTLYKKVKVPVGTPIYECNKKCNCGPDCPNRVVQDGRESIVVLRLCIFRTSNGCGWGVKTLKNIKKGTFVSLYLGEVIRTEEAERRGREYDSHGCTYLFDLDINEGDSCPYTVDAGRYGNISHFINHSCNPNLAVYNVFVNCLDPNLPKLALFTTRDIHFGEELSFDYKKQVSDADDEDKGDEKPKQSCLCGAKNCRKFVF